jgi:hypothetical protein
MTNGCFLYNYNDHTVSCVPQMEVVFSDSRSNDVLNPPLTQRAVQSRRLLADMVLSQVGPAPSISGSIFPGTGFSVMSFTLKGINCQSCSGFSVSVPSYAW